MIIKRPTAIINGKLTAFGSFTKTSFYEPVGRPSKINQGDREAIEEMYKRGMTQGEIAKRYGVTRSYIYKILSGDRLKGVVKKLSDHDVLEIRRLKSKHDGVELSKMFKVSRSYISDIIYV